jgi:DNA-binding phage protein
MNFKELKSCIDHEEATIQSYMRDPDFAKSLLIDAVDNGDFEYAQKILHRIAEARNRTMKWDIVSAVTA